MKRILVPLDGSRHAEAILPQVRRLLARGKAEVILFQAVYVCPSFYKKDYTQLRIEDHERARGYLARTVERLVDEGIPARFVVNDGPPPQAILDAARGEEVDLIVMTTHGRSGVLRWVMGSVAELVMQGADVPVLLHRTTAEDGAGNRDAAGAVERILVPVDGSARSLEILPHAGEMAAWFGAEAVILHVCKTRKQETARRLEKIEGDVAERLRPGAVPFRMVHRQGDPEEAVLDAANEHEVDLIAMTTHGENMKPRWTLGRVSEEVLRHTPVPMLVIRSTAAGRSRRRGSGTPLEKTRV